MTSFFTAFILIIILIYPAQRTIIFAARRINKHVGKDIPIIPNLPSKMATSQIKLKHGYANTEETKLAVRGAVIISGLIAAIITGFSLWLPILIWVVAISIMISFVD